jgi:electron transfer flavoprotein beta subunit
MQIFVCIKQALDWNASTKDFRIDPKTQDVVVSFARYRIDQFDEIALEVALQYRERTGGELRALTVGADDADDVLRHAYAMKADHATLVERIDSGASTPELLAAAVSHYGGGIVLCGRTSSGSGSGQTGPAMAEILGVPFVANLIHLEGRANEWLCRCETAHGYEVLKVGTPFVATVTNSDANLPRVPTMKDVMRAHRAKFETLSAETLCASPRYSEQTRVLRRYVPTTSRACERIGGAPQEQAKALARYIRSVSTQQ